MTSLNRRKLAVHLVVIFTAGVLTGGAVSWRWANVPRGGTSMENVCRTMSDRLEAQLGLERAQCARVRPILHRTAREIEAIHSRTMGDIDAALRRQREALAGELTPGQWGRLEAFEAARRAVPGQRLQPSPGPCAPRPPTGGTPP